MVSGNVLKKGQVRRIRIYGKIYERKGEGWCHSRSTQPRSYCRSTRRRVAFRSSRFVAFGYYVFLLFDIQQLDVIYFVYVVFFKMCIIYYYLNVPNIKKKNIHCMHFYTNENT